MLHFFIYIRYTFFLTKTFKSSVPNEQGLYPHEILLLDYAPSYYTSGSSFQGFWWYQYGVRDVQAVLSSLERRGFLQVGDVRTALNKQKVTDIKDALRERGIKLTGKKDDLIQRAIDEIPEEELNQLFPRRTFALTEKGTEALAKASHIPYIHQQGFDGLNIWTIEDVMRAHPGRSCHDLVWMHLGESSKNHFFDRNYGLYRNSRYGMAGFLRDEGKTKNALHLLAEVVFWDLTGASNGYVPQHLDALAEFLFPYEGSLATTAPGIISDITDCQNELEYSDEELRQALIEGFDATTVSVPLQLFTVEECAQIVFLEREKDFDGLTALYAKAETEFRKKYPHIKF